MSVNKDLSDAELIELLRRAGHIWFNNTTLLLLEELIRRYNRAQEKQHVRRTPAPVQRLSECPPGQEDPGE